MVMARLDYQPLAVVEPFLDQPCTSDQFGFLAPIVAVYTLFLIHRFPALSRSVAAGVFLGF